MRTESIFVFWRYKTKDEALNVLFLYFILTNISFIWHMNILFDQPRGSAESASDWCSGGGWLDPRRLRQDSFFKD